MQAVKMNGAGNAFLLIDARYRTVEINAALIRRLAEGETFDQILLLEPSDRADARYRIWNRDGTEVGACGNGARCAGRHLMRGSGNATAMLDTAYGLTQARQIGEFDVSVDLGPAQTDWQDIPLSRAMDTRAMNYDLSEDGISVANPGAVSMGNPHIVFSVSDLDSTPVEKLGKSAGHDPLFPEGINVGFMQIMNEEKIRLKVWERGAGLTKACGTGAAAAIVTGHRQGILERDCHVIVDGGELVVHWQQDNHVWLDGPVELEGEVDLKAYLK
ncbi:MAG: diaminopimelate epimerase [Hyphobacterium sp.]|nr:MAG: diaminopimelate epimerase [Hyphobacterium sp.]